MKTVTETTMRQAPWSDVAAASQRGAVLPANVDVAHDLIDGVPVNDRAHIDF